MIHDIGALVGGAEHSLYNIRRELVRRGHEVRAVTGDRPRPQPGFSDYTFSSRDATVPGKLVHYLYNHSAKTTISFAIRDFRPEVIHAGTVTKISPAGVKAMKGTPTIMDLRDYGLMYPALHKYLPKDEFCRYGDDACCPLHAGYFRYYFELLRIYLHRKRFDQIAAFVADSEHMKRLAGQLGMKPAIVLNSPLETIPEQLPGVPKLPDSILYAGRLEPEKGVLELVNSFELVRKSLPDAKLLIAGSGSLSDEIDSLIMDRGLCGSVTLLGHINRQELQQWYVKTRIVAIPSLWPEPFGRVGPEAMAFGVPVVASGRGGMTDWLNDGQNGIIADPSDVKNLAASLVRLLQDETLYQLMSENARQSVHRFRVENYVDELEALYRGAAASSKRLRSRKIKAP